MDKPKILIADDEKDNVVLLEKRLKASGFDTITAYDGDEALEKTLQYFPDLVLLDIMMPKKDGYEVLRHMREDEKTRNIPVIMLTARAETVDKVKGLELGAEDYVTKPFDYKELLARVNSHLESKKEVEQKIKVEKLEALSTMMEGVAHEVRNPLVIIGGFSKKLLSMTPGDDPRYTYIAAIEKEVIRLEKMIHDIYEFKTISLTKDATVSIRQCVAEVADEFSPAFKARHTSFYLFLDDNDAAILMDKKYFKKALTNIIDNALDAMPEGGVLTIKTLKEQKRYVIAVIDTGSGIKEDTLRFVFDPFYTSKMEGTGLGLTLALKIIQGHDGTIKIKSEKGLGTTVTIEINTP